MEQPHDLIDQKNAQLAEQRLEIQQLKPLRFLGANRAAVYAAMKSYWGDEELTPAWRQMAEVTGFSYALHAAVQAVIKESTDEDLTHDLATALDQLESLRHALPDAIRALRSHGEEQRAAALEALL